jgi:peptidoglycan/xylan/chitin deacetylase (PgdA/CDA1 family)
MFDRLLKLVISFAIAIQDTLTEMLVGRGRLAGTCVVINYHTISDDSKLRFGKQLDLLVRLARLVQADKELPLEKGQRYVAITVDDVFESFVTNGLPELCRRNIPVTLFPPTGYLGRQSAWNDQGGENKVGEPVVSMADLKAIAKFDNVHFGSHGVTHADLALLPEGEARQELQDSKALLEGIVAKEITALSFPYGSYRARELRLAREAGYKFFFDSTPQQMVSTLGEGLVGRVDVQATDWPIEFRLKVCGAYRWVRRASAWKRNVRSWITGASATGELKHA